MATSLKEIELGHILKIDDGVTWQSNLMSQWTQLSTVHAITQSLLLVQPISYRIVKLFAKRGQQLQAMLAFGHICIYIEDCRKLIEDEVAKSKISNHVIRPTKLFFLVHEIVNRREMQPIDHFNVGLHRKWCNCGRF